MMKPYILLIVYSLLLLACSNSRQPLKLLMGNAENGLIQQRYIGNTQVVFTYLPVGWERLGEVKQEANDAEMAFRINIIRKSDAGELSPAKEKAASYGVDTLFQLVLDHDTLNPLSAERIANGNLGGITYLVIFERRPMIPVQQAAFICKDWLFTNTRLIFPLQKENILIADSLSCRL